MLWLFVKEKYHSFKFSVLLTCNNQIVSPVIFHVKK